MPLELFVFVGTILEELISPIPSFLVMIPAGAATHAQGLPLGYLVLLAIISAFGRSIGASVLYWLSDKLEDIIFARRQRFFGVSHKDIEQFGAKLSTKNRRTLWVALFAMHAIPVFPGALLSLGCGFVKVPFDIFVSTTFFGSIIATLFYLFLGYAGLQTAMLIDNLNVASQITIILVIIALAAGAFYLYRKKRPSLPKK